MRKAFTLLLTLISSGAPALAQSVVVSAEPESTAVTVYREGERDRGGFDLRWLQGYALISEKRRIALPAGESTVRFEGVADGMIAVSAVVSGLPGGVNEKNRDARLLSPAALLDGSLGNRVHIRRTSRQTGKVTETDAVIRSGSNGAVVLETAQGVEGLQCSGLPETIIYDSVPEGLSAKPTFSVITDTPVAAIAEVTLTYLATGFDWSASYVAKVAEDGRTLDLFAWLTVANGNGATYEQTQLLAVAGRPNREGDFRELAGGYESPQLNLQCWPMDNTGTPGPQGGMQAPPPMPAAAEMSDIMVTAQKRSEMFMAAPAAVMAEQEELGDLKLYRVPVPVDVVPNAQKQVALLQKRDVPFTLFYGADIPVEGSVEESRPLSRMIRMHNRTRDGIGIPLPSGGIIVMQHRGEAEILLADSDMRDKAVGEKVEVAAGANEQLRYTLTHVDDSRKRRIFRLDISNATDYAAPVEIKLTIDESLKPEGVNGKLTREDGRWLWKASLAPNSMKSLSFRLRMR